MYTNKKKIDVILLCGGKGERLRPLTSSTPKPLLKVNKKPFLLYVINNFLKLDVGTIVLAAGYRIEKIKKFKKKYFKNNKKIIIIDSGNADIAQRIRDSSHLIKNDFFVCYGDTYIKMNLKNYLKIFYRLNRNLDGIVTGAYYQLKFGIMKKTKKNIIQKFKEKPIIQDPINLGNFIFRNKVLKKIHRSKSWIDFLNRSSKNKISIFITKKEYFTFDSPREYNEIKTTFI